MKRIFSNTLSLAFAAAVALSPILSGCQSQNAPNIDDYQRLLGDNVYLFSPADDMDSIQAIVDSLHQRMFREQFGVDRYAVMFLPGDYTQAGTLRVPYYMHMAGLGSTPYEVKVSNIHTPCPTRP